MVTIAARRLCPKGIFVRPRMHHHREGPRCIVGIVWATSAAVEQMPMDEAYLDVSAFCRAEDQDTSLVKFLPLVREPKQLILAPSGQQSELHGSSRCGPPFPESNRPCCERRDAIG